MLGRGPEGRSGLLVAGLVLVHGEWRSSLHFALCTFALFWGTGSFGFSNASVVEIGFLFRFVGP